MSRSIFTRANSSTQPGNLHLFGIHLGLAASALELALSMSLDPVE